MGEEQKTEKLMSTNFFFPQVQYIVARILVWQWIPLIQLRGNQHSSVAKLRLFTHSYLWFCFKGSYPPPPLPFTHNMKVNCNPSAVIINFPFHSWTLNLEEPAVFWNIFVKQEGYLERVSTAFWDQCGTEFKPCFPAQSF